MGSRPARRRALLLAALLIAAVGAVLVAWHSKDEGEVAEHSAAEGGSSATPSGTALAARGDAPPSPPPQAEPAIDVVEPKGSVSIEPGPEAIVGVVLDVDGKPAPGRVVTANVSWFDVDEMPIPLPERID